MNFIGGSGTTMTEHNPGFTVIDFDAEFMVPVDFHTYYTNMAEANQHPDRAPVWEIHHSFKQAYGLKDVSPDSLAQLTSRLFNDKALAQKYEENRYKGGNPKA